MDNDDLRRGRPTAHIRFGEAVAILAGDALLAMAFHIASSTHKADVLVELAAAAGPGGMVAGQILDLQSEGCTLSLQELRDLHMRKTGVLIRTSVRVGALLAAAGAEQLDALTTYGDHIGLAFQIADDILNVVGTQEALGKPVGTDKSRKKSTYPALVGLEKARGLACEAASAAVNALNPFGPEADLFRALAWFIVERDG